MIGRFVWFSIFLCLFSQCSSEGQRERQEEVQKWMENDGRPRILTTTAMIADLVDSIGGESVLSHSLIIGEMDPHSYQLVKGDDEKFARAGLVFYNGLGLEHGPSLHKHLNESDKAVSIGDQIAEEWPEEILYQDGQLDPHIWMDISLWARAIPHIIEGLSALNPNEAKTYQRNGDRLEKELLQAHAEARNLLQKVPENKRYLVTSHDAFNYFTKAYLASENENERSLWQKRFAAPEGLAPESQLSTNEIQEVIDHLKLYEVEVLFPESNVSRDSIRKILEAGRKNGLKLQISTTPLFGDAMGPQGSSGDSYVKMIKHNARAIYEHLNGPIADNGN